MHHFILHNDRVCEASEKVLAAGQTGLLTGWGAFSTIRVMDGVLFAWERHWARMSRDAKLLRVPMPADAVKAKLHELIEANGAAGSIFSQGYKYTFGVLSPASNYLRGVLDFAMAQNPKPKTVAAVAVPGRKNVTSVIVLPNAVKSRCALNTPKVAV